MLYETDQTNIFNGVISVAIRKKQRDPMLRGQTRAEMRQNKYRYLYQVRTAHGDVISRVSQQTYNF